MRKKLLCLVMAAALAAAASTGMAVTAQAEEIKSSQNWAADFDGERINSNFTSADMTQELYQLQPGDTAELQAELQNSYEEETDWYMTNEILQSLEESQKVAEGGAYTYLLTYTDKENRETVLYSSDTVGGEGESGAGEGLHQATDSLEEFFYLDRLAKGETGTVRLQVALDGETQGNAYQDTLARLQMSFAVEKAERDPVYRTGDPVEKKVIKNYVTNRPKTGDTARVLAFSAIALASGMVLLLLGTGALKKRREEEKECREKEKERPEEKGEHRS